MNTNKLVLISYAIGSIMTCSMLTGCKSTEKEKAPPPAPPPTASTTTSTTTTTAKGSTTTTAQGSPGGATATTTGSASNAAPQKAQFLFVQTAKDVSFQNGTMVLRGVNPTTVCFTDRPERIAGHMPTANIVPLWTEGKDSFTSDPPNATLSVMNKQAAAVSNVVVVLSNPRLVGEDLTYDIRTLEGTPPEQGGPCSLFIDIIGMPLTPRSYAGAARRAYRGGYGYGYPGAYGPAFVPRPVIY